jgi:O-antigen ligase
MNWKNVWDILQHPRVATRWQTIAALLTIVVIIVGCVTHTIGFVITAILFIWKIMQLQVPILLIVLLALIVFIAAKLKSQKLTEKDVFIIRFLDKGLRGLKLLFRGCKKSFQKNPGLCQIAFPP